MRFFFFNSKLLTRGDLRYSSGMPINGYRHQQNIADSLPILYLNLPIIYSPVGCIESGADLVLCDNTTQ